MDSDDDTEIPTTARSSVSRTHRSKREKRTSPNDAVPAKKQRSSKQATQTRTTRIVADDEEMQQDESSLANNITASQTLNGNEIADPYMRSGKVARIVLQNFMCHSNFAVDFNDHINLMVGQNGSGKSAVLTALIIGMGSKASATSRSSSLPQLIKRGETWGSVEIHLFNHPKDGYEINKYGSRIIIVRKLFTTGRTTYTLKNEQGHVVSRSCNDLMQLLMFLNIQVDNPVCVLNQDASRSFLRDSDPKKRFQLFLKATQIETIMEKLNSCSVHVKNARISLKHQRELLDTYEKTYAETQERYDRLMSVEAIKTEVAQLKCQQAWLLVADQEQIIAENQKQLENLRDKCEEMRRTCGNKESMEQTVKDYMAKFKVERDALRVKMQEDQAAYEQLRLAAHKCTQEHDELRRNLQKIEGREKRLRADIAQLQKDISERTETLSNRVKIQREEDEKKLAALQEHNDELTAMENSAKRDIAMLINTKTQIQERFDEMKYKRHGVVNNCERIQRSIESCDSADKNTLHVYGNYMPQLINAIQALYKRGSFTEMPRGPLGHYVELLDDKWKVAIETIIGGLIHSFVVNDPKDRTVLAQLIKREFPRHARYSIITTRFRDRVYDVSSGAVHVVQHTRRAMDVIRVSDPVVMNCLIDNCQVEMILLTENEQMAIRITEDEENVPRDLLRVLLMSPFTEFYPSPNYRSYSLADRPARYLQVDMSQRKESLQNELEQLKRSITETDLSMDEQRTRLTQISKSLTEKNDQRSNLQNSISKIRLDIMELKAIEYPSENEAEVLRTELIELQTNLEGITTTKETEKERYDTCTVKLEQHQNELDSHKEKLRSTEQEISVLQDKYDAGKRTLDQNLINARFMTEQLQTIERTLKHSETEHQTHITKRMELEESAKEFGERIEAEFSHKQLADKLRKSEQRILRSMTSGDSIEVLAQMLDTQKKRLDYTNVLVTTLYETLQKLHAARVSRYEGMAQLKQHMSLRIQCMFNSLLKLRNYSGNLKIDHSNQTLELSVVPRDKDVENAVSNAKSLSGGERSYTTIAFLLSLWACVDYPFYFLDEYDVFTDQVNRHYITKLLFSEAEKKKFRQYTFLTPQDMSSVEAHDKLSIHRLAEPQR